MVKTNNLIICYDADFIPFYVCHNRKGELEKSLDDCLEGCDNLIKITNNYLNGDYYCGFLTKGKCFRYDVNPDYKANRKYSDLPPYISEVKEYLVSKHKFMSIEGYEADDLVMSYNKPNYDKLIVSPDKDILYAVNKGFNPKTSNYVENTNDEIFTYFWSSMVIGDAVDNIKGIPGKGEAFVKKMLKGLNGQNLRTAVFNAYIDNFGENQGVKEFYKNYFCLKLIDNVEIKDLELNEVIKIEEYEQ
jgi:5'-3' exonuclease